MRKGRLSGICKLLFNLRYLQVDDREISVTESDDRLEIPARLLHHGDGLTERRRQEGAEGALDVGLARLTVALVVDAAGPVKRARPRRVERDQS